jgi:hypothetical protein
MSDGWINIVMIATRVAISSANCGAVCVRPHAYSGAVCHQLCPGLEIVYEPDRQMGLRGHPKSAVKVSFQI